MSYGRIFMIILISELVFIFGLGFASDLQKIDWENLHKFTAAIKEVKKTHYVTLDPQKTICTMPKAAIQELVNMLKDPDIHPIQRIMIAAKLFGIPMSPIKSVINWNEAQYRMMQRAYGIKLSKLGDEEARVMILMHESDEADSSEMYDDTATSIGEELSSIIAFALTCQIPDEIDYAIGGVLKERYLPLCFVPGIPSLYHFIKTGFLDQYVGDPIDAALGMSRSLVLVDCGVACGHIDPYVLINESNRVYFMQSESARDFAYKMREGSGELAALKAAGLNYGNEFHDPTDSRLRHAIKREFDVGRTLIRNLF